MPILSVIDYPFSTHLSYKDAEGENTNPLFSKATVTQMKDNILVTLAAEGVDDEEKKTIAAALKPLHALGLKEDGLSPETDCSDKVALVFSASLAKAVVATLCQTTTHQRPALLHIMAGAIEDALIATTMKAQRPTTSRGFKPELTR